jgi:hypothetical protein
MKILFTDRILLTVLNILSRFRIKLHALEIEFEESLGN